MKLASSLFVILDLGYCIENVEIILRCIILINTDAPHLFYTDASTGFSKILGDLPTKSSLRIISVNGTRGYV